MLIYSFFATMMLIWCITKGMNILQTFITVVVWPYIIFASIMDCMYIIIKKGLKGDADNNG